MSEKSEVFLEIWPNCELTLSQTSFLRQSKFLNQIIKLYFSLFK